jgi:hypothetical protein
MACCNKAIKQPSSNLAAPPNLTTPHHTTTCTHSHAAARKPFRDCARVQIISIHVLLIACTFAFWCSSTPAVSRMLSSGTKDTKPPSRARVKGSVGRAACGVMPTSNRRDATFNDAKTTRSMEHAQCSEGRCRSKCATPGINARTQGHTQAIKCISCTPSILEK